MSDPQDTLRQPAVIGAALPPEVTVTEVIEEGGQGVVYKGHVGAESAAVKVYLPGQVQKRIDREVAALGDLDCRTVVKLLWAGTISIGGQEVHIAPR